MKKREDDLKTIENLVRLGTSYLEKKDFKMAASVFLKPELRKIFPARINLAICSVEIGNYRTGIKILSGLKTKKSYNFFLNLKLLESYIAANRYSYAREILKEMLLNESGTNLGVGAVYALILDWIDGVDKNLECLLEGAAHLDKSKFPNLSAYANLIARLCLYWSRIRKTMGPIVNERLHVIGDSHCLSVKHTKLSLSNKHYVPSIHWIMGAKAYHLGRTEKNIMQSKLFAIKKEIPKGSKVVFLFGEIDLRLDEGLIGHCKKIQSDVFQLLEKTIDNYIYFIIKVFPVNEFYLYLSTVQAPLLKSDTSREDQVYQSEVILRWNSYLRQKASQLGLALFDVHKATVKEDNFGKENCFIDSKHLYPWVYEEVFGSEQQPDSRIATALAQRSIGLSSHESQMPMKTASCSGFNSNSLSNAAKAQLQMLHLTEAELAHLGTRLAIARTAKYAYARALAESLKGSKS